MSLSFALINRQTEKDNAILSPFRNLLTKSIVVFIPMSRVLVFLLNTSNTFDWTWWDLKGIKLFGLTTDTGKVKSTTLVSLNERDKDKENDMFDFIHLLFWLSLFYWVTIVVLLKHNWETKCSFENLNIYSAFFFVFFFIKELISFVQISCCLHKGHCVGFLLFY